MEDMVILKILVNITLDDVSLGFSHLSHGRHLEKSFKDSKKIIWQEDVEMFYLLKYVFHQTPYVQ